MASSAGSFLGRGSSSNNSNMRGLVQFIADLRNARARELEEKRINKELANIRLVITPLQVQGFSCKADFCSSFKTEIQRSEILPSIKGYS